MKKIFKKISMILLAISLTIVQFSVVTFADETDTDNLALNAAVTYSGVEGDKSGDSWKYPQFVGEMAVDGKSDTRWSANKIDEAWLCVDLGQEYGIGKIIIDFHAETTDYDILISNDNENWEAVASVTDGTRGTTISRAFNALGETARYVKFQQRKQWLHTNNQYYSSSIVEFKVYEHEESEIKDNTIRVGTFNIAATTKPDVNAQRALTDIYDLEVVGLQEVDVNTGRNNYDMLDAFASNNYTSSYFSKAIDYSGGEYGIGTVSRYPLSDTSTTFVDTTGASEARVFQRSVLSKSGKEIAFYNVHLSWETPEIREKQFAQIKEAIANDPIEYKIVVGDFNADQYYSEFYTFLEDMDMANGYDGKWHETFNGVDNTMKHNSIDNILISRNLKFNKIETVETRLSDHNLFYAEIEFLDEPTVSYQWLKAIISEYENIDTEIYTKASMEAFTVALENAIAGVGVLTTQTEVNTLTTALISAYESLTTNNLAYKKAVTYSGVEGNKKSDGTWTYPQFVGENAVDGNMGTRWSANKVNDAWMIVDLGEIVEISEVMIHFESAAPKYQILVSEDNQNWTKVYEELDGEHGASGLVQASFDMIDARYVKYQQLEQWKHSGNGNLYSTSYYEIEVYKEFLIKEISLPSASDVISIGDTIALKPIISPDYAAHKEVHYTSSNNAIAIVDSNGAVKGVGEGTATITVASAADDSIFTTFDIEVVDGPIHVIKLILDEEELTLLPRDKRFMEYKVYPTNAIDADLEVIWTSSNEQVAIVNTSGLITCVGTGNTTITVASKENPSINTSLLLKVDEPTYSEDYDIMQDRWLRRVVGDDTLDLDDSDVNAYIQNISDEAQELWNQMHKNSDRTTLWDMTDSTVAADYTTQFTKINKLTLAFGTRGTKLYQNKELYKDIISAINFMVVDKKYNGTYSTGNWWDWQIGCTHQLVDTLVILKDYSDYTLIEAAVKSIEGYAKDPAVQWPSYTATGANRTDIGLAVLGSAIVARSDNRMNLVLTKVPDVMKLVTSGDGLYADGSVVQHTAHAYTGSYGNELMKGIGKIQSITTDTEWEITDSRIENVYNTAVEGYIPLMERGRMMAMVNGRSISRAPGTNPFTTELASGSETISNLMLIAQFAPEEYSSKITAAIKYWLESSQGEYDFFENARDIESLLNAKAILNGEDISASRYIGMKVYGSMDRIVQATETYAVGLAMYSSRIYNYEYGNTENPKGWHTADGALYVYTEDYKQYGEGYWTAIDPLRLAGTTTDTRDRNDGADQSEKSAQSLVGGVSNGINGTGAMFLNKSHMTSMDLKAKKSYFFLDGKVIAVGSDINGTTPDTIETTIENRVISNDSTVSINGTNWTNAMEALDMNENSYVHYKEPSTGTNVGYYFPTAQNVNALIEQRTGKYTDINNYFINDKTYTMDFFSLGINHGSLVVDDSYEYVLFPDVLEEEIATYAKNNNLEIINTKDAHAILEGNIFAMNTFADNVEVNGFKVSEPACIYTETVDGIMTISISNPKQNAISLNLELPEEYKEVLSKSDEVTVKADGSFTINTTGAAGKTFTIILELEVDKTELQELITETESLVENEYTPITWSALQTALSAAKLVNQDTEASYLEVKESVDNLKAAINGLAKKPDKTELQELIEIVDALIEEEYTKETWNVLQGALLSAKTVDGDINATIKDVSDAYATLDEAYRGLKTNSLDLSSLEALLNQAKSLSENDYTTESWSAFILVYQEAEEFYAQAVMQNARIIIIQDAVDAMCNKLSTSMEGLIKVDSGGTIHPNDPNTKPNGGTSANTVDTTIVHSFVILLAVSSIVICSIRRKKDII